MGLHIRGRGGFGTDAARLRKQIIEQIENYIHEGGGEYGDWYVGLTGDPIQPVNETFLHHKVQGRMLTYIETTSSQTAQAVADYFVSVLGTDGNLNRKDTNGVCNSLYVYKKVVRFAGGAGQLLGRIAAGQRESHSGRHIPENPCAPAGANLRDEGFDAP